MDMNTHNKVALKFFADDEEFNVERATLKELASSPYIAKVRPLRRRCQGAFEAARDSCSRKDM